MELTPVVSQRQHHLLEKLMLFSAYQHQFLEKINVSINNIDFTKNQCCFGN